jgi:hypothetical protein
MKELVRMGSLLKTHRFTTALSGRPGEVIDFKPYSEGTICRLGNPEEKKTLHPNVLVYPADAD